MTTARNIFIAFLLGALIVAVPLYVQLRDVRQTSSAEIERLQAELDSAQAALAISSIHSRLGLLASAVRSGDFAAASQLSSPLYDEAGRVADRMENSDARRRLKMFVDSRDEVTSALATENPEILDRLDQLFRMLGASL